MQHDPSASVQLSLRLSGRTARLLQERAQAVSDSRNALAERLLGEALHLERHPLIYFRSGVDGGREPALLGTRLYVRQVISSLRESANSLQDTAEVLSLAPSQVQAAVDYYADFQDEIDVEIGAAFDFEERERLRWERAQSLLAS